MPRSWNEFEDIVKSMNTKENFEKLKIGSDFSAKLIKARLNKNLTQSELAYRTGLKQSAIARIENQGTLPRLDTVYKIAEALDSEFDFYPVNQEHEYLTSYDVVNKLSNLEIAIESLTNQVKSLTDTVNKKSRPNIILNFDNQQPRYSSLNDLQHRMLKPDFGIGTTYNKQSEELLQRGVEKWDGYQQYS